MLFLLIMFCIVFLFFVYMSLDIWYSMRVVCEVARRLARRMLQQGTALIHESGLLDLAQLCTSPVRDTVVKPWGHSLLV